MRGALEFERLFQSRVTTWQKVVDKKVNAFKKEYAMLAESRIDQVVESRLERRLERLVGIWDSKIALPDGFRKNVFLADVFAQLHAAPIKYRVSPFGNFFNADLPVLKAKHLQSAKNHPLGYAYRRQAFDWSIDETIDFCAQHFVLSNRLAAYRGRLEKAVEPNLKSQHSQSLAAKIRNRSGLMNGVEVAKYLGKSPATITRWVRENRIPHSRQNGSAVFHIDEIDAWLAQMHGSTST